MTLGLTNGAQNLGMYAGQPTYGNGLVSNTGTTYGSPVGSTRDSNGVVNTALTTVGVTADPAYSGLITKFSGLTLGTVPSEKLGNFYIRY